MTNGEYNSIFRARDRVDHHPQLGHATVPTVWVHPRSGHKTGQLVSDIRRGRYWRGKSEEAERVWWIERLPGWRWGKKRRRDSSEM